MFKAPTQAKATPPTGLSLTFDLPPQVGVFVSGSLAIDPVDNYETFVAIYADGFEVASIVFARSSSGGLVTTVQFNNVGQTVTATATHRFSSVQTASDSDVVTAPESYVVLPP